MADGKADGSELEVPFVFVRHGDPLPLKWMAEHPGWVRFPATLVPRPAPGARRGRATAAAVEAAESSVLGRPVSMGAPMVERPGMRNRGRPPRFPGRFGGEEGQPLREDPIAAYRRVSEQLAAMGLMEPVAAWDGKAHTSGPAVILATAPVAVTSPSDAKGELRASVASAIGQQQSQAASGTAVYQSAAVSPSSFHEGFNTEAYAYGAPVIEISTVAAPDPNGIVPNGPWTPARPGQLPGTFYGSKADSGPQATVRWVPSQADGGSSGSQGYFKYNDGTTPGFQRFDSSGNEITPEQAHPGRPSFPRGYTPPAMTSEPTIPEFVPEIPEILLP